MKRLGSADEDYRALDEHRVEDARWIEEQLLRRNVKRFRGGLVFKAHRLLYHSTLGLRVTKKKKKKMDRSGRTNRAACGSGSKGWGLDFGVEGSGWRVKG